MADDFSSTVEWQVPPELAGKTICQALRAFRPGDSWKVVRRLVERRRVQVSGVLCLDVARRLNGAERITVAETPFPHPPDDGDVQIIYLDDAVVVIEKPTGMMSLRHVAEINWPIRRRLQQPSADEVVLRAVGTAMRSKRDLSALPPKLRRQHLRSVHRLDRDTSGLLVFARTIDAERSLVKQFSEHSVGRIYQAIVKGQPNDGTIRSRLVRDRGDGLRGSTASDVEGKSAVTHVRLLESFGDHSLVECQLETGRTHQIRIHLAEQGFPVCGDTVYRGPLESAAVKDTSGARRLALHSTRLEFKHPSTGEVLQFETRLPHDLAELTTRLQAVSREPGNGHS